MAGFVPQWILSLCKASETETGILKEAVLSLRTELDQLIPTEERDYYLLVIFFISTKTRDAWISIEPSSGLGHSTLVTKSMFTVSPGHSQCDTNVFGFTPFRETFLCDCDENNQVSGLPCHSAYPRARMKYGPTFKRVSPSLYCNEKF